MQDELLAMTAPRSIEHHQHILLGRALHELRPIDRGHFKEGVHGCHQTALRGLHFGRSRLVILHSLLPLRLLVGRARDVLLCRRHGIKGDVAKGQGEGKRRRSRVQSARGVEACGDRTVWRNALQSEAWCRKEEHQELGLHGERSPPTGRPI